MGEARSVEEGLPFDFGGAREGRLEMRQRLSRVLKSMGGRGKESSQCKGPEVGFAWHGFCTIEASVAKARVSKGKRGGGGARALGSY